MVGLAAAAPKQLVQSQIQENIDHARADAPHFEKVTWYREPHLRKLYTLSIFLLVASATTGYDGMMVNTSQQMDKWKEYFPESKDDNKLGILINMFNIGSIIAYFISPYMADNLGRKPTIMVGCVIMIIGSCISAFCNGYGSKCHDYHGRENLGLDANLHHQCTLAVDSFSVSATPWPRFARLCS